MEHQSLQTQPAPLSDMLPNDLDYSGNKFLVIGGNGFLGSKLVEALLSKNAACVGVLDRVLTRFQFPAQGPLKPHRIDLCSPDQVSDALNGYDVIFHTASFFGSPAFGSFGEGEGEWRVNVEGTRNVIKAAREEAKRRQLEGQNSLVKLVYIGSASALYAGDRDFFNETEEVGYPARHVDHYGRTKAVAEQEVLAANSPANGLLTCVLRPNGIYGEGESSHFPRVRRLAFCLGNTILFNFGNAVDWTFVDNLTLGCFLAVKNLVPGSQVCGNDYNITDGEPLEMIEFFRPAMEATGVWVQPLVTVPFFVVYFFAFLVELVCFLLGVHPPCTRIEAIKTSRSHSFSIEKAKKHLGYVPLVSTEEGMKRMALDFAKRYPD